MAIKLPLPKTWIFPSMCPCCLDDLGEPNVVQHVQIRVDESVGGFFYEALTSKRFLPVNIPYCRSCAQHVKQYRNPEAIGCIGLLLLIGAGFVGAKIGLWGAIAAVVAPAVLYFSVLIPRRQRKAEGLRSANCCYTGPSVVFSGPSVLVIQSELYAKAFAEINGLFGSADRIS